MMPVAPADIRLWDISIVIAPSKISPWRAVLGKGECFTPEQLWKMQEAAIDPATVETIEVRSKATAREIWVPLQNGRQVYPDIVIDCPVVSRLRGKIQVISPIGSIESVFPSGRPGAPRYGRRA